MMPRYTRFEKRCCEDCNCNFRYGMRGYQYHRKLYCEDCFEEKIFNRERITNESKNIYKCDECGCKIFPEDEMYVIHEKAKDYNYCEKCGLSEYKYKCSAGDIAEREEGYYMDVVASI